MPQIDVETVVPILGRQLIQRMPVIAPGIVHQHLDRAPLVRHTTQHGLQCRDVAHVAGFVHRLGTTVGQQFLSQRSAAFGLGATKCHFAALRRKGTHQLGANARRTTRDKHHAIAQRGVKRVTHGQTLTSLRATHPPWRPANRWRCSGARQYQWQCCAGRLQG